MRRPPPGRTVRLDVAAQHARAGPAVQAVRRANSCHAAAVRPWRGANLPMLVPVQGHRSEMSEPTMRAFRLITGLVGLGFAALFGFAFHDRTWRWRDCFNELGRCWDSASEQVYLEQAGIVWGGLAGVCLAVALWMLWPRGGRS